MCDCLDEVSRLVCAAGDELRPPPIIYQGAQNQTLPVDSTALLPCLASGEPAPVLFWLKDTTPLASRDPRLEVLDSGALQIARLYSFLTINDGICIVTYKNNSLIGDVSVTK